MAQRENVLPSLVTLLDKASERCGSDAALAKELGHSRAYVSQLRSGKRPITPELAGILADIAGLDARPAVLDALMESLEKTPRGRRVIEAIKKSLWAGVAAICCIFVAQSEGIARPSSQQSVNTIYIVSTKG